MIAGRYLLSILLFICGHIYSQDIDGLIAYYPFSGNANDVTGNNHNGIVSNASLTSDRFGRSNAAYLFNYDGTKYISISSNQTLQPLNISVSLWAYIIDNGFWNSGVQKIITARNSCVPSGSGTFEIGINNGYPEFKSLTGACQLNIGADHITTRGIWHHFVLTIRGDTCNAYVDGMLKKSFNSDGLPYYSNDLIFIGGGTGNIGFSGKIDEVKIFNRAITLSEVQQIFSDTTSYTDINEKKKNTFSIFPNPSSNYFTISANDLSKIKHVEIRDIMGKTIVFVNEKFDLIDMSLLPDGLYLINVFFKNNSIETYKIIKSL